MKKTSTPPPAPVPDRKVIPRIRAHRNDAPDELGGVGVEIFIFDQESTIGGFPLRAANPITFGEVETHTGQGIDHSLLLSGEDAQKLANDLCDAGFMPMPLVLEPSAPLRTYESETVEALLAAKDAHISDLKELLSQCLRSRLSS